MHSRLVRQDRNLCFGGKVVLSLLLSLKLYNKWHHFGSDFLYHSSWSYKSTENSSFLGEFFCTYLVTTRRKLQKIVLFLKAVARKPKLKIIGGILVGRRASQIEHHQLTKSIHLQYTFQSLRDYLIAATSLLYHTPQTQASLAWDKDRGHSGGAALPLHSGRIPAPPRLISFGLWSFPIGSGPRHDGRALCQQLRVFLHHHLQRCLLSSTTTSYPPPPPIWIKHLLFQFTTELQPSLPEEHNIDGICSFLDQHLQVTDTCTCTLSCTSPSP